MDRRDPRHPASPAEAPHDSNESALELALRSGRGLTDLGVNRRAARLLEVAQIWSDTLLSVRHFDERRRTVTVGDRRPGRRFGLSAALVATLLIGVTAFMARHASLTPPPELSEEDAALIAAWSTHVQRSPALRDSEESVAQPGLDLDPLADRAERWRADHRTALERTTRAMAAGAQERRLLEVPPFHLDEQPGWEEFLIEELLPPAQLRADAGLLPPAWVRALNTPESELDVLDDPDVARVAEDLPAGRRVRRSQDPDAAAWMVVRGLDPGAVYVSDGDRTDEVAPETPLWPWVPTAGDRARRSALVHSAQRALYADALASRASRRACQAADGLLAFPAEATRVDLHARAARCALNRGDDVGASDHVRAAEQALAGDAVADAESAAILLRTRARLDLKAFEAAQPTPERVAAREQADVSLAALRAHIIAVRPSPSDLAGVARDRRELALDRMHEQHERQVQHAAALGLLVLVLLPMALVVDERRSRRSACDFFVDSADLPAAAWSLVERDGAGLAVRLPRGATAWRRRGGTDTPFADLAEIIDDGDHVRLPLDEEDQVVAQLAGATFVVHAVHPTRPVPGRSATVDWPYLGVLTALLFLSAAFTVVLSTADPGPTTQIADIDDRLLRIALAEPATPEPVVAAPREREEAGEGKRAPDPEGQRGRKDAVLRKAKGAKVAVRRQELDRQIALRSGILYDLDQMSDNGVFGQDGARDDRMATALGSLIGTQWGDQRGDGFADRGAGDGGGCMSEDCGPYTVGGTGTRGRGSGHEGENKDAGDVGEHQESGPTVGIKDPILIGNVDKATIDRIVKRHLPQIKYCYERELGIHPDLVGKITVKFVIGKDGAVSTSTSSFSTLNSPSAEACVHDKFRSMRFPPPKGGGIAMVRYPLVFNSR